MVFVSPHDVWHSSTILTSEISVDSYALSALKCPFQTFSLGLVFTTAGALDCFWSSWLCECTSALWVLGKSFAYNTLSSMIPGLTASMSTVLGLKVKIILYRTGDCRTLLSTFLSPGWQSKLSIRFLRWVTKQVRRVAPPPPWAFSQVQVPKGCRQWAARASLCWKASLGERN